MSLERIRELNSNLNIKTIDDIEFKSYGRVLKKIDTSDLITFAESNINIPKIGNEYFASVSKIEEFTVIDDLKDYVYGQLDIIAGTCSGQNQSLTGIEYHQGSETIIAVTDCVLILGKQQDLEEVTYDSSKSEVFYLKKGQCIELYSTTLHYSPCKVNDEGFITIVLLLKGTGKLKDFSKNKMLTKINKWFIAHQSQEEKIKAGSYPGLIGDLITVRIK